jgi:hypothetical protein
MSNMHSWPWPRRILLCRLLRTPRLLTYSSSMLRHILEMLVASLFLSSNIFVIKSRELCCRTLNMDKSCNLVPASLWLECFVLGVFLMEILIHPFFFGQSFMVLVFLIFDILLIIVLALLVTSDSSVVLHSKCLLFNWNAYLTNSCLLFAEVNYKIYL